ncbi:MAG: hypothetical protein KF860_00075 [Cyclobacteriaceae bacterium]|nr:hypothetical protein [Cyclobacteriaceae bacterium]
MNRRLIVILLIIGLSSNLFAKDTFTRYFDIRIAGFKIGELTAHQEKVNDSITNYNLTSKVSFWLFFRVNVDYSYISTFLNGQLIASEIKTVSNKGNFTSSSKWEKDHYKVEVDAYEYKKDTILIALITFNIAKLYFEQPVKGTKIYADGYGILSQAEMVDEEGYLVEVMGNKNKYYFKDGLLVRASMDSPIKNYEVLLIP